MEKLYDTGGSKYSDNSQSSSSSRRSRSTATHHMVYVRSNPPLPDDITNKQFRDHFRKLEVRWAAVARSTRTKRSKGYGFMAFSSQAKAERCVSQMNGTLLLSQYKLRLKYDRLKTPSPQPELCRSTPQTSKSRNIMMVENLHSLVTEDDIRKLVTVSIDTVSFKSLSPNIKTAAIHLSSREDADFIKALKCLDSKVFYGQAVRVCLISEPLAMEPRPISKPPPIQQELECEIEQTVGLPASSKLVPSHQLHPVTKNKVSIFVVVKNLAPNISKQALLSQFQTAKTNPITCGFDSKRNAYVKFSSSEEADFAATHFNGATLKHQTMSVTPLKSLEHVPVHIRDKMSGEHHRKQRTPKEHSDSPDHREQTFRTSSEFANCKGKKSGISKTKHHKGTDSKASASKHGMGTHQTKTFDGQKSKQVVQQIPSGPSAAQYKPSCEPLGLDSEVLSALGDHIQPLQDQITSTLHVTSLDNGATLQVPILNESTMSCATDSDNENTLLKAEPSENEPLLSENGPELSDSQNKSETSALLQENTLLKAELSENEPLLSENGPELSDSQNKSETSALLQENTLLKAELSENEPELSDSQNKSETSALLQENTLLKAEPSENEPLLSENRPELSDSQQKSETSALLQENTLLKAEPSENEPLLSENGPELSDSQQKSDISALLQENTVLKTEPSRNEPLLSENEPELSDSQQKSETSAVLQENTLLKAELSENEPLLSENGPELSNSQQKSETSALLQENTQPGQTVVESDSEPECTSHSPLQEVSPIMHSSTVSAANCSISKANDSNAFEPQEETPVTMKPKTTAMRQGTVVHITTYICSESKVDFKMYLDLILGSRFKFDVRSFQRITDNGTAIEIQFYSVKNAKLALQAIENDMKASGAVTSTKLSKKVIGFKNNITKKRKLYLSHLKELKDKYHGLMLRKNSKLHVSLKIEGEEKDLMAEIVECELQQEEFDAYCDSLDKSLDQLLLVLPSSRKLPSERLSQMRKDFGRECARFDKGLPIYAHRSQIIETIKTNQVCILIGETGSGKSTQLVQYLYDAGFGENGVIVCTQPRKVAAITLANHVSTEMCVPIGTVLGYKTGLKGKFNKLTKVLYMTDHTLLNECIKDPLFSNYSVLVIDEVHERSIHTDILLAFIKQCLPQRKELKIIITSATIDPSVFKQYFQVRECPVIQVLGRVYPVDVKWNALGVSESPMKRDYVLDAVDIATSIHRTEPPGDILVFLTSAAEIERACHTTTDQVHNTAVVLPLHGKLQPEEQQKVFQDYQEGRKIVFATNVAETSVTIPGVKYIVDSGLAKVLKFDPKKNLNSLEVSMISKSSAEQRKGRAGRTSAGKCYRMYSEDLHSTMQDMLPPEIQCVTLSHTALKLYEFGVTDIFNFDFFEHPDPAALKAAIESLEFLGAVKDGQLTEVGKKMCALPIDPHLSKVLLDGIEQGIGLEAATAVAISILGGNFFFRGGSDETKMESDGGNVSFCHPAGDQMTYLTAYYQWSSQTNRYLDNHVNFKCMRAIRNKINELREILSLQLNSTLSDRIITLDDAEAKLPKLFFNAFIQNIAVHLGHERAGYLNERLPDERLFVFPGSSLCQLNPVPKLVAYEKTLMTSQHFLLQVLPVKEEWIQEAITDGRLSCHPLESPLYAQCKVSPISRDNLGMDELGLIYRARNKIEERLKQLHPGISIIFEFLRNKGVLKLFLHDCHNDAIQIVEEHLREDYKKKQFEYGATKHIDNVRMVLGCGGTVQHVLMPHQYRSVKVKGPLKGIWLTKMIKQLEKCGEIQHKHINRSQTVLCLFVTFGSPSDALKAVESVKPPEHVVIEPYFFQSIFKQDGETVSQFTLEIEWCRSARQNHVKSFETKKQLSKIKEFLDTLLVKTFTRGQYTLHMPYFHLPIPKPHSCTYKAYVQFQNPDEGQATLIGLQNETILGVALKVNPKLSSSFRYSPAVYAVIEEPLDLIIQELQDRFTSVKITEMNRDKRDNVIFEIHSNNVSAFIAANNALNSVLQPEVVSSLNPTFREYMQTSACELELKKIESSTSTYIYRNLREMNIKMYGGQAQLTRAKIDLNNCLKFLSDNVKCINIELKGPGKPPGLMKHFVSLFGHDLKGLVDDEKGITVARINPRKHILTLFATEEGHQSVLQIIGSFIANADPDIQTNISQQDVIECCACLTDTEGPVYTFRLEYCGHPYCLDCVQMQVAPSAVEFPILCAAEGCSQPFVWNDFENLFQYTSFNRRQLANASLKCYVGANPNLIRNCPTPDCSSIYRVSEDGKYFYCSACQATTCTKCHEPYHDVITCEMYQYGKKRDAKFEKWIKCNPETMKRCPQCTVPIEKTEECNHLFCTACHAHVCWVCLQCFDNEQRCYAHLDISHDGFT